MENIEKRMPRHPFFVCNQTDMFSITQKKRALQSAFLLPR